MGIMSPIAAVWITERAVKLRAWTKQLAGSLRDLGVKTFHTETYFFLADFAPHDAGQLADRLKERNIFIKPLNDLSFGSGFMRVTTALPEENARFIEVLKELL